MLGPLLLSHQSHVKIQRAARAFTVLSFTDNDVDIPYSCYYKTPLYLFLRPFGHSSRPRTRFFQASLVVLVRLLFKRVLYSRASYNSENTVISFFTWSLRASIQKSTETKDDGTLVFLNNLEMMGMMTIKTKSLREWYSS